MPDLLPNLIAAYGLKKTRPYEASIAGEWWEGRIAGSTPSGAELARRFFLRAHPPGTFDYPQLRAPAVATALSRLSPAVTEVMVCENFRGLELLIEGSSSRESFDRDVAAGVDLLKALESWGSETEPHLAV